MKQLYKQGLRKCYLCKKTFPLSTDFFYKSKNQCQKLDQKCIECDKLRSKKRWEKRRGNTKQRVYLHLPLEERLKIYKLHKYQYRAKQKNFNWDLTEEQFLSFLQKPCYYCGVKIEHIGLDRLSSTKGYNLENVVSCCIGCNRMKMQLTKEEFIKKCKMIAKRF